MVHLFNRQFAESFRLTCISHRIALWLHSTIDLHHLSSLTHKRSGRFVLTCSSIISSCRTDVRHLTVRTRATAYAFVSAHHVDAQSRCPARNMRFPHQCQRRYVLLKDHPKSLHNFYNFVFVDEARRGPHIRAIDIRMNMLGADFSEDVVDRFLALLAAATRLRTLTLHAPGHPRVLPAVAGLTSLHELGIAASMDVAGTLLAGTRSALGIFLWQVRARGADSGAGLEEARPSGQRECSPALRSWPHLSHPSPYPRRSV